MEENRKIFACSPEMYPYNMTAKRSEKPRAYFLVNQNTSKSYARILETNSVTFHNEQKYQILN